MLFCFSNLILASGNSDCRISYLTIRRPCVKPMLLPFHAALSSAIEISKNKEIDLLKVGLSEIVKRYGFQTVHDFCKVFAAAKTANADYRDKSDRWEERYSEKAQKQEKSIFKRLQNYQREMRADKRNKFQKAGIKERDDRVSQHIYCRYGFLYIIGIFWLWWRIHFHCLSNWKNIYSLTGLIPRCLHCSEKRKLGSGTPYACIGVVHSNAEKSLFPQNEVWYNENDRMKVRIYTSNAAQKERML